MHYDGYKKISTSARELYAAGSVRCWNILLGTIMISLRRTSGNRLLSFETRTASYGSFGDDMWHMQLNFPNLRPYMQPFDAVFALAGAGMCDKFTRHPPAIIASFFICHAGECAPGVCMYEICRHAAEESNVSLMLSLWGGGRGPRGKGRKEVCANANGLAKLLVLPIRSHSRTPLSPADLVPLLSMKLYYKPTRCLSNALHTA